MNKRKWMAVSVTTMEALNASIAEKCRLFCVDGPLYWMIRNSIHTIHGVGNYEITHYDDLGIALFKRIHDDQRFDDAHFEPYYTSLIE